MKYKEYIPSEQHWKDMYAQYPAMYRVVEKFPIEKIRRRKMPNKINHKEVWGGGGGGGGAQMCMRYIDVVMQNKQKIK